MEQDIISQLTKRRQGYDLGGRIKNAMEFFATGKAPAQEGDSIQDKLMFEFAKRSMEPREGFATEGEIPQTVGGKPIKTVTTKGGRYVPTYGDPTPLLGGFDMGGMVDSFDDGQPPVTQPTDVGGDNGESTLEDLIREARENGLNDEQLEEYLSDLEQQLGGQQ